MAFDQNENDRALAILASQSGGQQVSSMPPAAPLMSVAPPPMSVGNLVEVAPPPVGNSVEAPIPVVPAQKVKYSDFEDKPKQKAPELPGLMDYVFGTDRGEPIPSLPTPGQKYKTVEDMMRAPIGAFSKGSSQTKTVSQASPTEEVAAKLNNLGINVTAPTKPVRAVNAASARTKQAPSTAGSVVDPAASNLKKLKEEIATAPTELAKLQQLQLNNQADAGKEMADAQEEARIRTDAFQLAKKQREDERIQQEAQVNADIDKAQKEAADFQVHDGGFLSRNPGAILMAIGAVFGGALSARTGQPNTALQSLDATINRDIQAQKDQLAQKKDRASGLVNSLGRMRELFKDQRAADMAEELSIRRSLNDKLENIVQTSKNQQMRDQGAIVLREGRAKEAQIRMELAQREANARAAQAAEERKHQLEFTKMAIEHRNKMEELAGPRFEKQQQQLKETYVPGYGFAATSDQAAKLKAAVGVKDMVGSQLPAIIKEFKDLGATGRMFDIGGRRAALEQRIGGLMAAVKNEIVKTGTSMTEGEARLIGLTQDDVSDWFDLRGIKENKLKTFQSMVDDNVNSQLKSASIEKGNVATIADPMTGQPIPYYMKEGTVMTDVPTAKSVGTKEE